MNVLALPISKLQFLEEAGPQFAWECKVLSSLISFSQFPGGPATADVGGEGALLAHSIAFHPEVLDSLNVIDGESDANQFPVEIRTVEFMRGCSGGAFPRAGDLTASVFSQHKVRVFQLKRIGTALRHLQSNQTEKREMFKSSVR